MSVSLGEFFKVLVLRPLPKVLTPRLGGAQHEYINLRQTNLQVRNINLDIPDTS